MVAALFEVIQSQSRVVYFLSPLNCTTLRGALELPMCFLNSRKFYAEFLIDCLALFNFADRKRSFGLRDILKRVEGNLPIRW